MYSGRQLDRRWFEYTFKAGSRAAVIEALVSYQNEDGGFGNGLEPDLRTPASSAIATSLGLHILRDVKAPSNELSVRRAIEYLLKSYDEQRRVWPIIPPEAEDAPHAPWWNYKESEGNFGGFLANPRAAIVGHMQHYAQLVPAEFLEDVTASVLSFFESQVNELEMHDLLAYLGLAGASNLREEQRSRLMELLKQAASRVVESDPAQWSSYGLRPLDVAPSPRAPLADVIGAAAIQANLDYEVEQQLPDGSWALSWSWGGAYPDSWGQAERDWKGHLAVIKLKTLRDYGRVVGLD